MKEFLKILPLFVFIVGCSAEEKNMNVNQRYLTKGTFYLNFNKSNDTLRFQSELYDKGHWNNKIWRIKRDSIFQEDSRGLSFFSGEDRRKYVLSKDTLTIWTNLKISINRSNYREKEVVKHYLVLKSNKRKLELIDLNKHKMIDHSNEITKDILLR